MEPRREEVRIESHVMSIVPLELKLKENTYYTLMIAVYNNIIYIDKYTVVKIYQGKDMMRIPTIHSMSIHQMEVHSD